MEKVFKVLRNVKSIEFCRRVRRIMRKSWHMLKKQVAFNMASKTLISALAWVSQKSIFGGETGY